jgi:hypothetical protein
VDHSEFFSGNKNNEDEKWTHHRNTVTEGEKRHILRLIAATAAAATQVRNMCHSHLNL